jgi:hypothetical protein
MSQLSPSLQSVLELFQGPLAELRFADVDSAALAELASSVESAASAVAEQEARLTELRQSLTDRQDALLLLAQRALAYARVYAEPDPALTEQLSRITLPKASKPRKPPTKAAGSEPAVVDAEVAPAELAATEPSAMERSATESSAMEPEPAALDAMEPEPAPSSSDAATPRAGKRRSRVATPASA